MMKVLLLDVSYIPKKVIDIDRAYWLFVNNKVRGVSDAVYRLHSTHKYIDIPQVVVEIVKPKKPKPKLRNRYVPIRDKYTCAYCGVKPGTVRDGVTLTRKDFNIDHIKPKAKKGKSTWLNVITACVRCNLRKDDKTLDELGWTLRYKPTIPEFIPLDIKGSVMESWKPYVGEVR